MRRKISLIIICFVLFIPTGCYDSKEINESTYIAMLGVDEGVKDKWQITLLLPFLGEGGDSGSSENEGRSTPKYTEYTIEAPSFFQGISLTNTSIRGSIIFFHTNVLVFSEDLAKSGKIGKFIAPLIRNREIRRSEFILVSKGSAKDFLGAAIENLETSISKEMEDLIRGSLYTGYFPKTNLNDLNNGIKSTYHQTLAIYGAINNGLISDALEGDSTEDPEDSANYYAGEIPRKGGKKIDLAGSAVFNGDKMVGKLTIYETQLVLITKGLLKRWTFAIPDPKEPDSVIPIEVRPAKKPQIRISFKDKKPVIDLKLKLNADILAIQSRIDYEDPSLSPILEKAAEVLIKRELDKTIKKCKELKSDVFDFGNTAAMKFATIQEWEDYNWNERFEDAEINTTVSLKIKRFGTMISDSPIISTEGKEKSK